MLSKYDLLKALVTPNVTDIIIYIENHGKEVHYVGSDIHYIYCYLDMIGAPTTLTCSDQNSNSFGPDTNTYSGSLNTFISSLGDIQRIIFDCHGLTVNKTDSFIIRGPNLLTKIICRNNDQYNSN